MTLSETMCPLAKCKTDRKLKLDTCIPSRTIADRNKDVIRQKLLDDRTEPFFLKSPKFENRIFQSELLESRKPDGIVLEATKAFK